MQTKQYYKADEIRYTGQTMLVHGFLHYAVEFLEGRMKGAIKAILRAPKVEVSE